MRGRAGFLAFCGLALAAQASGGFGQATPAGAAPPERPYIPRIAGGVMETAQFRSTKVTIGGGTEALLYAPKTPAANGRVGVVYANRGFGFGPPAIELASRGYRVLHVSAPVSGANAGSPIPSTPYEDFREVSQGIGYLRSLGVKKVVVAGWGAGASTITLYAALAEKGPAACQGRQVIYPCTTAQASGLAKPDGVILFDTGLGAGTKPASLNPGRPDLDPRSPVNGYDPATDTARFPADFRKRFFAAQAARNTQIIEAAVTRLNALGGVAGTQDEALAPGTVPNTTPLSGTDLTLLSRTKRAHPLLKADGTTSEEVLRSIRPTASLIPGGPPRKPGEPAPQPRAQSLREFLANDAIRTTPGFALTEDDVTGIEWASSNLGTPAQAESVSVPALLITNTCFQFVTSAEIVLDHLASKDKTQVGIEGSDHDFRPCQPQYGDTKKRLFDYAAGWLAKPGRF